jgi:hypothetical protein
MADINEITSVSTLISRVDLLNLNPEAQGDLIEDAITHQDALLGGLRIMGAMFEKHAQAARSQHRQPDEFTCEDLEQIGKYFVSSADLLSGLSCTISELSAIAAVRRIEGK